MTIHHLCLRTLTYWLPIVSIILNSLLVHSQQDHSCGLILIRVFSHISKYHPLSDNLFLQEIKLIFTKGYLIKLNEEANTLVQTPWMLSKQNLSQWTYTFHKSHIEMIHECFKKRRMILKFLASFFTTTKTILEPPTLSLSFKSLPTTLSKAYVHVWRFRIYPVRLWPYILKSQGLSPFILAC